MKCRFDQCWEGKCNLETIDDNLFCIEHCSSICDVCGNQAVKVCPEASSLICGRPLCENHKKCKWHCSKADIRKRRQEVANKRIQTYLRTHIDWTWDFKKTDQFNED